MSNIKEVTRKIDPDREYNLSTIREEGLFPWIKNIRTVRKIVKRDYWGENTLKALITGEGRALDYKIKGARIIKFVEKYGPGFMLGKETKIK